MSERTVAKKTDPRAEGRPRRELEYERKRRSGDAGKITLADIYDYLVRSSESLAFLDRTVRHNFAQGHIDPPTGEKTDPGPPPPFPPP